MALVRGAVAGGADARVVLKLVRGKRAVVTRDIFLHTRRGTHRNTWDTSYNVIGL